MRIATKIGWIVGVCCLLPGRMWGETRPADSLSSPTDSLGVKLDIAPPAKKRPWMAGVEVVATDAFFHLVTRFIVREDYAQIGWRDIQNNFKVGFMWDNDEFETNIFSHPYQGGLYFNAARSLGLNFWESAPYALLGSAIWELFLETQPPSINDILSTPLGGMAFGEVTHRLSSLVLNGRARGWERVWRELAATALNPIRGVNRVITGEAWRVGPRYVDEESTKPYGIRLNVGYRLLDYSNSNEYPAHMPSFDVGIRYNNPFAIEGNIPFEYFDFRMMFNFAPPHPVLGEINLSAPLWGRGNCFSRGSKAFVGIFQNFNYYNSGALSKREIEKIPFRITEAVAYGPGAMVDFQLTPQTTLSLNGYASGVVLGGAFCDYYDFHDRDYNMGSGYSLRLNGNLSLRQRLELAWNVEHIHLFTWKGYEHKPYKTLNPHYIDAQGAVGNSRMQVINLRGGYFFKPSMGISAEVGWRTRQSYYRYFPDVKASAFEIRLLFSYRI